MPTLSFAERVLLAGHLPAAVDFGTGFDDDVAGALPVLCLAVLFDPTADVLGEGVILMMPDGSR